MIKRKYMIVTSLATISVLLGSLFYYSMAQANNPTSIGEYDPWVDLNDDGFIDIYDAITLAGAYGTSGDPTKNINVVNWPVSRPVMVWYGETVSYPISISSFRYNVSGFGHLHVLIQAPQLYDAEEITVYIYGILWNSAHTGYVYTLADSIVLTSTSWAPSITIPVPSEEFMFRVAPSSGTSSTFYLSFYLTWA